MPVVKVLAALHVDSLQFSRLQGTGQLLRINRIRFHHALVLGRRDIGSMHNHATDTQIRQGVVGGETTETRLVSRKINPSRVMFLQIFKELTGRRLLAELAFIARFGNNCNTPSLQMNVNTYVDILTFKINSFTLYHRCN